MKQRIQALLAKLKTVRKTYIALGISVVIILVLLVTAIATTASQRQESERRQAADDKIVIIKRKVALNGKEVLAEVAASPQERQRGLMYRTTLDEGSGMLFTFANAAPYPFWMKNMRISIDIIWIGENLQVIDLDESIPPCAQENCELYTPSQPVKYVLEVPAGWAQRNGIAIGATVELKESVQELVDPAE